MAPQDQTRRVRFIPGQKLPDQYAERNVLIEWEDPQVDLRQQFKFLGVQNVDPNDYRARYGSSLTRSLPRVISKFPKNCHFESSKRVFFSFNLRLPTAAKSLDTPHQVNNSLKMLDMVAYQDS